MSKSQTLRLHEVRAAFRLIDESRDLGDDATAWTQHMLTELCRLYGAQVGMRNESGRIDRLGRVRSIRLGAEVGWASAAASDHWRSSTRADTYWRDPIIRRNFLIGPPLGVWSAEHIVPTAEWYRSRIYREVFAPCGIDDILSSILPSPGSENLYLLLRIRLL